MKEGRKWMNESKNWTGITLHTQFSTNWLQNDVTDQSESSTLEKNILFYLQWRLNCLKLFLVYDKFITLHLELKWFREENSIAHFIINTIMLTPNTDEHLPLLFSSVEMDVFGCRVVTVRKKTRTIVSAREEENISAGYLEIFISFSVISLIKCDSYITVY